MSPERAVESLIAFGCDKDMKVFDYGAEAAMLGLAFGDKVVRATCIRSLGGEPLGLIESVVPSPIRAALSRAKLNRMPLIELLRVNGHIVWEGQQVISAVCTDPGLAARLQVEPRAAITRGERLSRSAAGIPLAHTIAHYRGDRYRLALDMQAMRRPITT